MPPTLTSRLSLSKPDTEDVYDITVQNNNMDILDAAAGVTICTSSTRPATPYTGMLIYETDTDRFYGWDGDSWEFLTWAEQAAITICTSGTRPSTTVTGKLIWETDTAIMQYWDGSAWQRLSPGLLGGNRFDGANSTLFTAASNTTEQLITGMETPTVTIPANRSAKVTFFIEYDSTVANDRFLLRIRQTNISGAIWTRFQTDPLASTSIREHAQIVAFGVETGGSPFTGKFVLTTQRNAGTGTLRVYKAIDCAPVAMVELLGHAGAMTSV